MNDNSMQTKQSLNNSTPYQGQPWLVEERDACGVGFIASKNGHASHQLVEQAVTALGCLEHRGACSADRDSGDGAGIMSAIPWQLLENWLRENNLFVPSREHLGVGMLFLPLDEEQAGKVRACVEKVLKQHCLYVVGWRPVPVKPEVLGEQAQANRPRVEQVLFASPTQQGDDLEKTLYITSAEIKQEVTSSAGLESPDDFYICSFSNRTIVYKGMVRSVVLGEFYLDFQNPDFTSPFAIYHRRFSTNTMPKWRLAQPMRLLGHNGEINTLLGNINWMLARVQDLKAPHLTKEELATLPLVSQDKSDSANLDNVMELLVQSGRSPMAALMMLIPEAYQNQPELADRPEIINFYEYHRGIQEPWDGPALIVFSDGKTVGANLDRNGLRPARYCITKDDYVIVGSEAGVLPIPEADIVEKGRLGPGEMLAVDLERHQILKNWEIKQQVAQEAPYGEWLRQGRKTVELQTFPDAPQMDNTDVLRQQSAFGYTAEDVEMIIQPMATQGKEATFCMGDDIPLAVLSDKPRLLFDYFKQRFAQVTNPPIDPLRESLVMSLQMCLGEKGNLLQATPEHARMLKIQTPILNTGELEAVKTSGFASRELSTLFSIDEGPQGLENALQRLQTEAAEAVKAGSKILVLSDRVGSGINEEYSYIPPLLAVGTVHHHLIEEGLRMKASLVVDTAQCWSTHHFACLIGYGASAVCPYLALESIRQWVADSKTQKMMENGRITQISCGEAQENYRHAIEMGLLKILSKMGISLLSSYSGAQIFEAIGLGPEVIDRAFAGTTSRVGGLNLPELAQEVINFHNRAFPELKGKKLENYGFINYRPRGEYHMNSPEMAKALHKAVAGEEYDHYEVYTKYLEERPATALRDLLDFSSDRASIPIEEVEPVEEIVKRFCTGAMSLGSLSREAHETLAVAMNRIGGKSNSGEGGEDPDRYAVVNDADAEGHSAKFPHLKGLKNGDTASSATKQVASGRFGVTPEYLMNGQQIEIKVAQGAKPGEGGQLPGKKVSPYIAMLRRSKPGVPLISPPPHHDIYSIEDLSQLIFDLHQVNPQAKVSVKLVAEVGIGTVAAGVAKANADVIQISGHDGGTGASPLSSIKHAGTPWELGVTEVHGMLLENQLRDRVILRADGGFKTGWDVLMGALMGAEEYGFGSVSMIAEGCIMARICHTNNCPVGVATQQEKLRERFSGTPGHVVNFFYFVAQEVRMLLARLGYRRLDEVIGRSDLLTPRQSVHLTKTQSLNLDCLINLPDVREHRSWLQHEAVHSNGPVLDDELLNDPEISQVIQNQGETTKSLKIVNTDRAVGARIAGQIAKQYGDTGFEGQLQLNFQGAAGQSFGAFNLSGMNLKLTGEANDYVGKGMNGGEIVIVPPEEANYEPANNSIIGNTCLYGATGGSLYANGQAGERFAVRNSFGHAVIMGAGDHCCEYMTGGVVVVLGKVGRNVGAGMTGGIAYFLDEEDNFPVKVNTEIVSYQRISSKAGEAQLKELIAAHAQRTGSKKSQMILDHWETYLPKFWQIVPPSEAETAVANSQVAEEEKTLTSVK
jgi:glutamate synthase (ferredoxin)